MHTHLQRIARKMRILFAIKALDDVKGGAERVLVDISSGLANRGHTVSVLSFDNPGGTSFYSLSKKVNRISLGIGNAKHKANLSEIISRMIAIRKETLKIKPDVFIAFMHSTFIPASFALIGTGIPVIASEHIVPIHYKGKFIEYMLFHLSFFFVKKITVLSETIKNSYSFLLRRKMMAIPNPVHATKKKVKLPDNPRNIILNVARLTKQKDQETLIYAFAKLTDDYPDWDVRIIGEGELRDNLECIINEYGLQNRVLLLGTTPKIELEYQQALIFALPSAYESFGLATAEAMAHGLPAIGFSNCPGTNELITHYKNGLLVEGREHRINNFSKGLKNLMTSAQLRKDLGIRGINDMKKFHPEKIILKWEKLISEIYSS